MGLPNADSAQVDREKIADYLLSPNHPDGAGKARFFTRFGFVIGEWVPLADALRRHGQVGTVVKSVESDYGTRYIVEGRLETPDGRNPKVRTVWILETGGAQPRLITAYPCEDDNDQGT